MILKTKRGRLTRYALACGYIERSEYRVDTNDYAVVTLCMDGSVLLVKTYTRSDNQRSQYNATSMKNARAMYSRLCKQHKGGLVREQIIYSKGSN